MTEPTHPRSPRLRVRGLGARIFATVLLATVLTATTVSAVAAYGTWTFLTAELERRAPLALARTAADLWDWSRARASALEQAADADALRGDAGAAFLADHGDVTGVGWREHGEPGVDWNGAPHRLDSPFGEAGEGWPALALASDDRGRTTLVMAAPVDGGEWIGALDPETLAQFVAVPELGREASVRFIAGHPATLPPAHRLRLGTGADGAWSVALGTRSA